ncbi:MAG: tyrosine-protein phosphatase [Deltaproteobacteria bacterium]|uniref:Tyrosine-protein phosphatase n=1 Tax=Candidatus Zymogenus saltonus TaxID=2844893 RepID=A0A9D8KD36_9DELT|nr:tyrosine-protein phosphatase [Candidatus Zymogenus saltonus]
MTIERLDKRWGAVNFIAIFAILAVFLFAYTGYCEEGGWVKIEGGSSNFRDVGGYKTDGGEVRSGVLYRSGDISGIGPAGVKKLVEMGVVTVVDLRDGARDVRMEKLLAEAGIRVVKLPMKRDNLSDKAEFYRRIIVLSRKSLMGLLDHVSDKDNLPAVIFDEGGLHEVEVATMFLLGAVGVGGEDRLYDYLRSNERGAALQGEWGEHINRYFEDYGGMEYYITTILKVSPDVVKKIKKNLVE